MPFYMYDRLWRLPVPPPHPPLFGQQQLGPNKAIDNLLRHILQDFAQFKERFQTTVLIMKLSGTLSEKNTLERIAVYLREP